MKLMMYLFFFFRKHERTKEIQTIPELYDLDNRESRDRDKN